MRTKRSSGGYGSALRSAEFDAIATSSLISILGDSAAYLAVTVLVYQRTHSPLLASLTFAVGFVPYLFGGTLLAALVDRLPAKRLLVGSDLVGAALVALTAVPGVPLPAVYAVLFVIGMIAPARAGASGTLVVAILPGDSYVAGRSVLRICAQSAQILGAAAGGGLVAVFGPRGALLADSGSFVLSAALIATVLRARPKPDGADSGGRHLVADSVAGIRSVWGRPDVRRLLLLSWLVAFVAVAPEGLAAPAVTQSGHAAAWIGFWLAALPVGTVLGDLLAVWLVPPRHRVRLTWPLAFTSVAVLIAFAADPPFPVSIALLVLGGGAAVWGLGLDQLLRDLTPPAVQGRMFALHSTGLMSIQGLGFAAAGALGQVLPADDGIAAAGLAGVLVVALLARSGRTSRRGPGAQPARLGSVPVNRPAAASRSAGTGP